MRHVLSVLDELLQVAIAAVFKSLLQLRPSFRLVGFNLLIGGRCPVDLINLTLKGFLPLQGFFRKGILEGRDPFLVSFQCLRPEESAKSIEHHATHRHASGKLIPSLLQEPTLILFRRREGRIERGRKELAWDRRRESRFQRGRNELRLLEQRRDFFCRVQLYKDIILCAGRRRERDSIRWRWNEIRLLEFFEDFSLLTWRGRERDSIGRHGF